MSFTELTAEDKHLSLETLRRMSMETLPDGSVAQRIVLVTVGDSIYIESGSITGYFDRNGTFEGRSWWYFRDSEIEPDEESPILSCLWTVAFGGDGAWIILDENGGDLYYSTDNVDDPRDCTTWVIGSGIAPLPTVS